MVNTLGDLTLTNISDKGVVPQERLKNAQSGRELFTTMSHADRVSAGKRAEVQAMRDGKPPYDQNVLIATGQGSRTNLNFGDAEVIGDNGEQAMMDVVNSVETLVKIPLVHNAVSDPEQKRIFEEILADEASRTIREWSLFETNFQTAVQRWFWHGVGIAYFENTYDWRFEATGLDDMKIPRETRVGEDRLEIAGCRREYRLHEIYEKIKDAEAAARMGWNVPAVKAAMLKAQENNNTAPYTENQWERLQAAMRDDDLNTGARSQTVRVIHLWVKEFDGTASMYVMTEDKLNGIAGDEDPFLLKKRQIYKRGMKEAFTFFTLGIGTNSNVHSIAGMGRKIYPHIQVLNRTRSNFVDAANMSAGVMLQPKDEASYERMQWTSVGSMVLLPAADVADVVDRTIPNLSQTITPVLADMQNALDQRTGQLTMDSPYQDPVERTTSEINALVQTRSRIGASHLAMFYKPWGRLLREMIRRLCRPDYSAATPGGDAAETFRRRISEKGFPVELLMQIDFEAIDCVKAIGAGSDAARIQALEGLQQYAGSYDEVGRHNLIRDLTAARMRSFEIADRYVPRLPQDARPPMDKQIADMENSLMELGKEQVVVVNQMHVVHLDTHLPKIAEMLQRVESGEVEMLEVVTPMTIMHAHCVQHLEQIEGDPIIEDKINLYRQALSNAGEIVWNANKQLVAEQKKAQEEGAEQQQGGGLDPMMERKLIEYQLKLQHMDQAFQMKLAQKQEEQAQKKAFRDADQSQKMLNLNETIKAQLAGQKAMEAARNEAMKNKPKPKSE